MYILCLCLFLTRSSPTTNQTGSRSTRRLLMFCDPRSPSWWISCTFRYSLSQNCCMNFQVASLFSKFCTKKNLHVIQWEPQDLKSVVKWFSACYSCWQETTYSQGSFSNCLFFVHRQLLLYVIVVNLSEKSHYYIRFYMIYHDALGCRCNVLFSNLTTCSILLLSGLSFLFYLENTAKSHRRLLQRCETSLPRWEEEGLCVRGVPPDARTSHQHVRCARCSQECQSQHQERLCCLQKVNVVG